jgi:hypothetical protein
LLAAAYPGIPGDFTGWPDELKRAWTSNIPHVIAMDILHRSQFDYRTPDGMYRMLFEATGDEKKAQAGRNEINLQKQIAAVTK